MLIDSRPAVDETDKDQRHPNIAIQFDLSGRVGDLPVKIPERSNDVVLSGLVIHCDREAPNPPARSRDTREFFLMFMCPFSTVVMDAGRGRGSRPGCRHQQLSQRSIIGGGDNRARPDLGRSAFHGHRHPGQVAPLPRFYDEARDFGPQMICLFRFVGLSRA